MPAIVFLYVFLAGVTINSVNHPGPRDLKSVENYFVQSVTHPTPADWTKLND